jgi:catechol-2,3-dioxygenase
MMSRVKLDDMKPSSPGKFAHIVLRSRDVAAAREWYKKVLNGWTIMPDNDMGAGLTYDAEHHRVLILGLTPMEKMALEGMDVMDIYDTRRKLPGLEHFAYTHDNVGNLLSTYKRLKKEGIEPVFNVNHGGTLSFYYLDPDGNSIELLVDIMTMDQATEFMSTPAFRENGIGYPIDPEELCERYDAGVPLSELLASPYTHPQAVAAE